MKLIVGLGNPGKEYENTRHNVGFIILDKYLKEKNITNSKEKFGGLYYETFIKEEKVMFLKPQKYINLSGQVLKQYIDFFKVDIDDVLIIHVITSYSIHYTKLYDIRWWYERFN